MANSLPKFSRNYAQQGEYANPKTIIDQSPGVWANTISNLGKTISEGLIKGRNGLSSTAKETQTYLDENAKFIMESYDEFSDNINKSGVRNPSLNETGVYAIRMKGEAAMGMKRSTTREQQSEFSKQYAFWDNKLNELIGLVQAGNGADETYNEQFVDGYANANTSGGISTVGLNDSLSKQYQLAMPVRLGGTRNPREQWFFDPEDGYKIKTMYTSDQIDKAYKEGNIDNPYVVADPKVLFTHESTRIDPIDKEFREFVTQTFYDKDKKPLEQFLKKQEETVEYKDNNGNKMQKIVKPWDEASVLGAWTNYIAAKSKSYSKYPNQAKALWDTVLEQGRNIITTDKEGKPIQTYVDGYSLSASDGTPGTALTAIDSGVFAEAMLSYSGNFLPPEGEIISKSKVIKPEKPTEAEKEDYIQTQKAENYFKRVEDYLKSSKGLPIPPPGLLFVNTKLTDEGRRFKSDLQKLVSTTGGKVVEFTDDIGTQEVFADIKYGDADVVRITEAQFKDPNVFNALLKQATGVDVTGSGVVKANYFNKYKD